jgi:hypothetical protein
MTKVRTSEADEADALIWQAAAKVEHLRRSPQ